MAARQHEDTTTNKSHAVLLETRHDQAQAHVGLLPSSTWVNTAAMGVKGLTFRVKSRNTMVTTARASGAHMEETRLDTLRTTSRTMATSSSMIRVTTMRHNSGGGHQVEDPREDQCLEETGMGRHAREDTAMA